MYDINNINGICGLMLLINQCVNITKLIVNNN